MALARAIGIDLGTTYSCAAIVEGNQPRVIRSRLGYTTIPSIVTFDEKGETVVGQAAERRMILQPEEAIYGSKRLLGRAFLPGVLERFQPHFQYRLVADDEGLVAAQVCGRTVPLVDVSAAVLGEIRRAAQESLGAPVERAVVTVPAYFNENQRTTVREAGRRTGLEIIRIINEPTAAALCFGFNRGEKKRLLVFDLGGGTFDVSIVELDGNVFNAIGTDGDTFLGGLDFDGCLVDFLMERLSKRLGRDIQGMDAVSRQRLRMAAQETKHQLSVQEKTIINVPRLKLGDGSSVDLADSLTRTAFEDLTRPLVDRTLAVVTRALEVARLRPADIQEVLLVGGQTRMPIVQKRLRDLFQREPSKRVHPDEVVALGAAIAAESHDRFDSAVLLDVVPLPISVLEPGGQPREIIRRNTQVPHEAHATVGVPAGTSVLKLAVFQGASGRPLASDYLGTLVIDGIPPADQVRQCQLLFQLDAECLLKVSATIAGTTVAREVSVATKQTPDEVIAAMGKERIHALPEPKASTTPPPGPNTTSMPAAQTHRARSTVSRSAVMSAARGGHAPHEPSGFFARLWARLRRR